MRTLRALIDVFANFAVKSFCRREEIEAENL